MPIISMFYGIIVRLYLIDNKHHNLPHIHASMLSLKPPLILPMVKCWQANYRANSCVWCKRGLNYIKMS
jgi:hypothetical protein